MVFTSCSSANIPEQTDTANIFPDDIVNYAMLYLNTPYKYGGNTPTGFDCSGFVSYVFKHFNILLPRTSSEYINIGIIVKSDQVKKGDIILFSGSEIDLGKVGHVGIITSVTEETIQFIHASSSKKSGGVIISDLSVNYYRDRFIGIRRITNKGR